MAKESANQSWYAAHRRMHDYMMQADWIMTKSGNPLTQAEIRDGLKRNPAVYASFKAYLHDEKE